MSNKTSYRIRGFLTNPDYQHGHNPVISSNLGSGEYVEVHNARKKIQTLIHERPVKPMILTRKSDFEFIYGKNSIDSRNRDHRRHKYLEQRFEETKSSPPAYRDYTRENKITNMHIEREYVKNVSTYNPFGRPGGGAPTISTRRTKNMYKDYTRENKIRRMNIERDNAERNAKVVSTYYPFGRPGAGAPSHSTRRTKNINEIMGSPATNFPQHGYRHKYDSEIFRKNTGSEFIYGQNSIEDRNRDNRRHKFLDHGENIKSGLPAYKDYTRKNKIARMHIEKDNANSESTYNPFGRPGGGAPQDSTRRTKNINEIINETAL